MESKVKKWGNSLAVRIPKPFAEEINLKENDNVNISVKDGRIVIEHAVREYELEELIDKVEEENIHEEYSCGKAQGKEIW